MVLVEEEEGWQKEERRPKNHIFKYISRALLSLGDGFRNTGVTGSEVSYGVREERPEQEWKEKSFTDF